MSASRFGEVEDIPILIIGGSLVGLTTAMFLARQGVDYLCVERHPGTAIHPRAGHLHLRTQEIMRSVGLEDPLRQISADKYFPNGTITAFRSLGEGPVATYSADLNAGLDEYSPSLRTFVLQHDIEPLIRAKIAEYGGGVVFNHEASVVGEDDAGVVVELRDRASSKLRRVRARFVVAADGGRSTLRDRLGIRMRGHRELSKSSTIYFRADYQHLLNDQEIGVAYIFNDQMRGFMRFEKTASSGSLVVQTLGDLESPDALNTWEKVTPERAREFVAGALGVDKLDVSVDKVAPWTASAQYAEKYQSGRYFLAGDSAHVVPPNGGFGGNTGIQDAHNLAWKLALVVQGHAGQEFLTSYEWERQAVGRFTVEQAYSRYRHRTTPNFSGEVPLLVDDLRAEIGYRYLEGPLVDHRYPDEEQMVVDPREAAGRPGTRAAHFWQGPGVSSLDLFGDGFVVVTGLDGQPWLESVERIRAASGFPISGIRAACSSDELRRLYGLRSDGAALIRPDGYVAWQRPSMPTDPSVDLLAALRRMTFNPAIAVGSR